MTQNNEEPFDPFTAFLATADGSLDEGAIILHEWFTSLTKQGFTEDQAMKFMALMIRGF